MLSRLWDFFVESLMVLFLPAVSAYHLLTADLFVNVSAADATGFEKAGNFLLIPFQYLFAGRIAIPQEDGSWTFIQQFDYHDGFWIKTSASIVAAGPSFILGSAIKGLGFLSHVTRTRHASLLAAKMGISCRPNLELYQKWGMALGDSDQREWLLSQGHRRRPGDELILKEAKDALAQIGAILNEAQIPWWVDCGTCLGTYRYGGIIPWDDDLDIAILVTDFENVRRALNKLDPKQFHVQDWSSRSCPDSFFKIYLKKTRSMLDVYCFKIDLGKTGNFQHILFRGISLFSRMGQDPRTPLFCSCLFRHGISFKNSLVRRRRSFHPEQDKRVSATPLWRKPRSSQSLRPEYGPIRNKISPTPIGKEPTCIKFGNLEKAFVYAEKRTFRYNRAREQSMTSSWDDAKDWYSGCVGEKGHYYHQSVVIPGVLRMLKLLKQGSLLDLGCGQGVLARSLPASIEYVGIDLSKALIDEAKRLTKGKHCSFYVGDATGKKLPIEKNDFDLATCILSLQNMEHGEGAIQTAARYLKREGELLLILNHPCFRIPRQSGWGVDEKAKLQYRRMNAYMSPMDIPLQIHPGKGANSEVFHSYHHPLSDYMCWLSKWGFALTGLEEWCSDKKSEGSKKRMEDRARSEIPLFLTLRAILFKKAASH